MAAALARLPARPPGALACLGCGYSLAGLPSGRCPECGTEHTPRYLVTGQRPSGPRPWSAQLALAVGRTAWTASAAACSALAVFAAAAEAPPVAGLCAAAAALAVWRRVDLGWRPERVERLDGAARAELGIMVAVWAGLCLAAILALGAVGALILRG